MEAREAEAIFAPLGLVRARRMFGGLGLYCDGLMFALEADGEFWLKADTESRDLFREAGSRPFVYQGKGRPVEMSYWLMPEVCHDDPDALRHWGALAMEAARRKAAGLAKSPGRPGRSSQRSLRKSGM